MKLSFVIPCYGSEKTIEYVISEIDEAMAQRPEYRYEIICVNDFSPDNVLAVLRAIAKINPHVMVADLAQNMGKHAAVMAGYSFVSGDIVITLDDDGQCPVPNLWDLIEPLSKGYDVSFAKYPVKKQSSLKNFGSKVNNIMTQLLINMPKGLTTSNFCAVKHYVVNEVLKYQNPYPYIDGLLIRTTKRIAQVPMEQRDRVVGRSYFTLRKSLSLWLNGFTAFSVKPLRFASFFGMVLAVIGIVAGLWIIIRRLFITPDMQMGYPSLMVTFLFIGGVILATLGMLGEYIGRIYISINNSPQYVIREIIKGEQSD
jgi:undecaprenyl-phosphate 4-deoxy-4-formamido-L-arabinose transferase